MFFSLSLGMGAMITYGSYVTKTENIESCVRSIEFFDTLIALLAGFMIIPAVFVFSGGDAAALGKGPTLMFCTLPKVFDSMFGGQNNANAANNGSKPNKKDKKEKYDFISNGYYPEKESLV